MTASPTMKRINHKLEKVYKDILRIEETELKKSQFRDLSIKEMHTIDAIGLHQKPSSSEVATRLSVTQGTLTVAINNLVRKGYAVREHGAPDRRVVNLALTRKGRLMFRAHQAFHQQMVQSFVQGFDEQEVRLIEAALDNLMGFLTAQK
ncbi:MarR family winged helix-turn-helix transcriptional regulator [Lacticaseibacillus absianus]|uniref:MarR family winged helix-turn-helix transcriptional regulator n=1 Tax=Lacticaseibacillus absianus TaxID=2729623 RepID=UPI0015CD3553|nr:MarR family winged helix-turn-helix transcriptional regulator [Lacticaseibacillus absianus]